MHRRLALVTTACLLCLGGCARPGTQVLGRVPAGEAAPVSAAHSAKEGADLVLTGEMVEKCPVAGCWFDLQDDSGTIRVDTKNAGFVVLDVPVHARVTVAGRLKSLGSEPHIEAVGVRY